MTSKYAILNIDVIRFWVVSIQTVHRLKGDVIWIMTHFEFQNSDFLLLENSKRTSIEHIRSAHCLNLNIEI
jgi:hypothetical protein